MAGLQGQSPGAQARTRSSGHAPLLVLDLPLVEHRQAVGREAAVLEQPVEPGLGEVEGPRPVAPDVEAVGDLLRLLLPVEALLRQVALGVVPEEDLPPRLQHLGDVPQGGPHLGRRDGRQHEDHRHEVHAGRGHAPPQAVLGEVRDEGVHPPARRPVQLVLPHQLDRPLGEVAAVHVAVRLPFQKREHRVPDAAPHLQHRLALQRRRRQLGELVGEPAPVLEEVAAVAAVELAALGPRGCVSGCVGGCLSGCVSGAAPGAHALPVLARLVLVLLGFERRDAPLPRRRALPTGPPHRHPPPARPVRVRRHRARRRAGPGPASASALPHRRGLPRRPGGPGEGECPPPLAAI